MHARPWLLLLLGACQARAPAPPAPPVVASSPLTVVSEAPPPPPEPPPEVIRPCPEGSPEALALQAQVEVLDGQIKALGPREDPAPLVERIRGLLKIGCFRVLPHQSLPTIAWSSLSLREFWRQGGRTWLEHPAHLSEEPRPALWVAPTPRRALTLESSPRHPLAPVLLCSEQDAACGLETQAWAARAHTFFGMFDLIRQFQDDQVLSVRSQDRCVEEASQQPPAGRFVAWFLCEQRYLRRQTRLPLGHFRAPTSGWLIVSGRRGHHSFCDEVRAYDLATGAAYVASNCSELVLQSGGSVNGQKTDQQRKVSSRAGRLRLEALREAAWMMALQQETDRGVVSGGYGINLPEGMEIVSPENPLFGIHHSSFTMSSGQTSLRWRWEHQGKGVAGGRLSWPEDYNDAAKDHAVKLLQLAEEGFVAGCPPARLPPGATLAGEAPGVASIDASADSVKAAHRQLLDELEKMRTQRVCAR